MTKVENLQIRAREPLLGSWLGITHMFFDCFHHTCAFNVVILFLSLLAARNFRLKCKDRLSSLVFLVWVTPWTSLLYPPYALATDWLASALFFLFLFFFFFFIFPISDYTFLMKTKVSLSTTSGSLENWQARISLNLPQDVEVSAVNNSSWAVDVITYRNVSG